ncbi:DUF6879 family protein [Microtetraspora niveoalba]|uniref:DUF6879 family protein n=1 Tax=Microtetraspora niveoalba TaxID=46175 RepID=UPI00083388AF|nr:DUF6879 family protein [Microtetraspora niveoalba]
MTKLVTGDEFLDLFTRFQDVAFRLEVRDRYNVLEEQERLALFLADDLDELDRRNKVERAPWLSRISAATTAGKRVERVRVFTEPPSDYVRFELHLNAGNAEAGEDIRYLPRTHPAAADLPSWDYWLFDSTLLAVMRFGPDDAIISTELVDDPDVVRQHCTWRDAVWPHAVPYASYVAS